MIQIRKAGKKDYDGIWEIFESVIKTGDTYVFDPRTNKEALSKYWLAPHMKTYVAEEYGKLLGTYIIKPNQTGLGAHVANCSYMVHPNAQGKGIGKKLCEHSLENAKNLGFKAIQFNIVVSTNQAAVNLWKKYGFKIIGTIPKGFNHLTLGYVDAHIMYKEL
ncbi:GNAT family N-acetyltransferase [Fulvivirgaceae bacterium BMA12]|uniref:GNAT family N-acetyltransferase n=1 Tax=Agaribacillus aureus TaxID=3051825 RepID=A0ABT8LC90_9BACT|nr:GNAT family N-acetyltransferase [Fulvivirgaceae bacterium BMA12]